MATKKTSDAAKNWNDSNPVGTAVRYWPVLPASDGFPPVDTRTRSEAWELGSGHAVVKIEGRAGGVHLSHVEVKP